MSWLSFLLSVGSHIPDAVFAFTVIIAVRIASKEGIGGLLRAALAIIRLFPGVDVLIQQVLRSEVRGFVKQLDHGAGSSRKSKTLAIPEKGIYVYPGVR